MYSKRTCHVYFRSAGGSWNEYRRGEYRHGVWSQYGKSTSTSLVLFIIYHTHLLLCLLVVDIVKDPFVNQLMRWCPLMNNGLLHGTFNYRVPQMAHALEENKMIDRYCRACGVLVTFLLARIILVGLPRSIIEVWKIFIFRHKNSFGTNKTENRCPMYFFFF